jgi:uncharacterized membrane protein YraQ (UPF0718 family)
MTQVLEPARGDWASSGIAGALIVLLLAGGLVAYKSSTALRQIDRAQSNGAITTRSDVVPVAPAPALSVTARSLNYMVVIWQALVFGLLISAAVRAFVPADALTRLFEGSALREQVVGGAAGAPLMLCSCCVTPIFSSVYRRSARLGPALALMLAAPALNPAALALTFILFSGSVAWARLAISLLAVFVGTALVARIAGASHGAVVASIASASDAPPDGGPLLRYLRSLAHVALRTVPLIVIGVVASMFVSDYAAAWIQSPSGGVWVVVIAAAVALPLALPTFFEIPLAVALLGAGAPAGAAVAVLFAGPAVNLPSLLTVGRVAGWKAMTLIAAMVWLVAVAGGLAVS